MKKVISDIISIASQEEDPFYIYHKVSVENACRNFLNFPEIKTKIHFAAMANSTPEFLSIIKNCGLKIFVNSIPHMQLALNCGFCDEEIIFAASAMSREKMNIVVENNCIVFLDSLSQFDIWNQLFPERKVGLRCNITRNENNPRHIRAGVFLGKDSRLGLSEEELNGFPNKYMVNGLHIYPGTDLMDIDSFLETYKDLMNVAMQFPNLEYLDFGGGFGIDDEGKTLFDIKYFRDSFSGLVKDFYVKYGKDISIILEPGRIIASESCWFVTKITDIKIRNKHIFVGTNASSVQFPRPLMYPNEAIHPVFVLDKNGVEKADAYIKGSIYGCSTYSRDFLARNILLPKISEGDLVVFGNAGAYCSSAFSGFLGFPKPKEFFV